MWLSAPLRVTPSLKYSGLRAEGRSLWTERTVPPAALTRSQRADSEGAPGKVND